MRLAPIVHGDSRIIIRSVLEKDYEPYAQLMKVSLEHLHPWVYPPTEMNTVKRYFNYFNQDSAEAFSVIYEKEGVESYAGLINLNGIIRGGFQSGYLAFYLGAPYANKGIMSVAVMSTLRYIFEDMKLHRVEASIQPENKASLALIKKCGFIKEGFSRKLLKINGIWKDHERWALLSEDFQEK